MAATTTRDAFTDVVDMVTDGAVRMMRNTPGLSFEGAFETIWERLMADNPQVRAKVEAAAKINHAHEFEADPATAAAVREQAIADWLNRP